MENKNQEYCSCCGQPIKNYKMTFTSRNVIWLYTLGWIGKNKYKDSGFWVNYKEVHEFCRRNKRQGRKEKSIHEYSPPVPGIAPGQVSAGPDFP